MVFVFVFVIFFLVVIVESKEGDEKAPALASCWGLDGLTSLEGWTETAWKLEAVAKLRVSPNLIKKKYRYLFVNKEDIQWPCMG